MSSVIMFHVKHSQVNLERQRPHPPVAPISAPRLSPKAPKFPPSLDDPRTTHLQGPHKLHLLPVKSPRHSRRPRDSADDPELLSQQQGGRDSPSRAAAPATVPPRPTVTFRQPSPGPCFTWNSLNSVHAVLKGASNAVAVTNTCTGSCASTTKSLAQCS